MKKRTLWLRTAMACLVFSLAFMALWQPVEAADVLVVANKSAPTGSMDEAVIKNVFLGKTTSWPDGSSIEFVILADGPAHESLLEVLCQQDAFPVLHLLEEDGVHGQRLHAEIICHG